LLDAITVVVVLVVLASSATLRSSAIARSASSSFVRAPTWCHRRPYQR
jgi:hypothetical protein